MNHVTTFLKRAKPYQRLKAVQSAIELQKTRLCPLCNSRKEEEHLLLQDFQLFDDQGGTNRVKHRIVSCRNCGFIHTNPCYTKEGFDFLFAKAGQSYGCSSGRSREQADWLLRHIPDCKSVVDIGCGSGSFLQELPDGIVRLGLDIDEETIQKLNEKAGGISFQTVDFSSNIQLPTSQVITMFHVLEHLSNPAKTLADIRRQSTEETRLIIEVPAIDSAADIASQDIVGFFTIQHLSHFSTATLKSMLSATGWEVIQEETFSEHNGVRVIAVPAEEKESYPDVVQQSLDSSARENYLTCWRKNVHRIQERLNSIEPQKSLVVWGAGQHTEYLDKLTELFHRAEEYLIVDSDPLKQGTTFHGIPTLQPDQVPTEFWIHGEAKIVISSHAGQASILKCLLERGVKQERVIALYDSVKRY